MRGPRSSRTSVDSINSALCTRLSTWEPGPASTPVERVRLESIGHGRWLVEDASSESRM